MSRRFLLASLAMFSICSIAAAQQTYTPALPDNALSPGDPVGVPPQPSTAGTHEAVSTINGGLSFFLPVLTLPQRGGWNLTLGYYNTSPGWNTRSDSSTQILQSPGAPNQTNITYTNSIMLFASGGPLSLNLPTIQASIEYAGQIVTGTNLDGSPRVAPVVCVTNWVFTDWSGNRHPFTNVTDCSAISEPLAQVTDSTDGSWLRMDTTNYHSDITVRTKDGTIYHFPGWLASGDPFSGCNQQSSCYGGGAWAPTRANFYSTAFSSVVDSTGQNTVTFNSSNGILTDTIGRQITIGNGITYKDPNGNPQTIAAAATQQPQQTYNFSLTCSPGKTYPNLSVGETYGPMSFPEYPYTYTVTLPAVNGVSRIYTMQFDGVGNLLQVTYPSGGYTKYDYQDFTLYSPSNIQTCSRTDHQIAHKRECPLSTGACSSSQELVTTYSPSPDGSLPFNDSMSVQDPLGDVTTVHYQNQTAYPFSVPHETTRQMFPPGSQTPVRTIQTTYTSSSQPCGNTDVFVPSSVTTTLNDISPALSAATNYQYQTVTMQYYYFSNCGGPASVFINNATEIDEYDYGASNPAKKTAQTWMTTSNGSLYDIAGGHLLDRLATRTLTDPATSVQSTLSYGYNSVGDITSKTVGGTGLTSLVTNYQRDAYGNITQLTDPKGNITKYGYTDTWAQTTCAPGSNSSAYPTSITDALYHITNFAYNSCTGSKASTTDPNNAKTSFSYDALGRATSVSYPDGGQGTTTYVDSVPNSVTVAELISSSTGSQLQTKTLLDGFRRKIQTQLLSDPDGVTYADTTYDALGRVASVSNPYRGTTDPTYGITHYQYDALDRPLQVTEPDGSVLTTVYSGNQTTVTDEAGKQRESQTDALGRLIEVVEPDPGTTNETPGTATVSISGAEQSQAAQAGSGSFISLSAGSANCVLVGGGNYAPQNGTITVTINGATPNVSWGGDCSGSAETLQPAFNVLVSDLASAITQSTAGVTATANGSSITLKANTTGANTNYSVAVSETWGFSTSQGGTGYGACCSGSLSGGRNGSTDSGTASITVNGFPASYSWGASDSASSITSALMSQLNSGSSPVSAAASGSTLCPTTQTCTFTLTANGLGSATDYSLSASIQDSAGYSPASFSISAPSSLTGGTGGPSTTLYTYDAFDNLLSVTQKGNTTDSTKWRVRTFTYDSLSRLTRSINPESNIAPSNGAIVPTTYSYDANGNLTNKTSPAQNQQGTATVTVSYCYDALNRITSKAYTSQSCPMSSPISTFTYDLSSIDGDSNFQNPVGRLIMSQQVLQPGSNPIVANTWMDYDPMGRVLHLAQCARFNCGPYGSNPNWWVVTNSYDLAGDLYTYTDAEGNTFTQNFTGAGRPNQLSSSFVNGTHPGNLVSSATYFPNGALKSANLGNGLTNANALNTRLQPCRMDWNTTAQSLANCTSSTPSTSILDFTYGYNLGTADNGNLASWSATGQQTFTRSFGYDNLNRLATMSQTSGAAVGCGSTYSISWNIDPWGNRSSQTFTGGSGQPPCINMATSGDPNNRLIGYPYDTAGNLLADASYQYQYDVENHLTMVIPVGQTFGDCSTATACYFYNAEGQRIAKYTLGGTLTTFYIYGTDGEIVADTDGNLNWNDTYIHFGGQLVAQYRGSNTGFLISDHLGSTRLDIITPYSGSQSVYDNMDYLPFGEQIAGASSTTHKFTTKERDDETNPIANGNIGLDNFGARYYASSTSRWLSPDVINLTSQRLVYPSNTLNKYVYAADNPLKFVDRDGEDITIFYRPPTGTFNLDFGHIFIGAVNQDTKQVGFLDFYPKGSVDSSGKGPGAFNLGNMQDRAAQADAGQFATLTIRTTPEEAQKVLNLIKALQRGDAPGYAALSKNCTTICEDVLRDLGLDFGDILPSSFFLDAVIKFNPQALFRYTVRDVPLPPMAGIEYGNPRSVGMNYTRWLFQLYLNQSEEKQHDPPPQKNPDPPKPGARCPLCP